MVLTRPEPQKARCRLAYPIISRGIDCQLNIVHKFMVKYYMLGFLPEAGKKARGDRTPCVRLAARLRGLLGYLRDCVKEDEGELPHPCEQCISHL
jgi:hypothetical protein